jgi:Na+-driven multidrug efflux pump
MVGQALGARKPERAEKAVWLAGFYNMCFLGVVGLLFELFAGPIVTLFTSDVAVAAYAIDCLRIVAAGFLFYAYGMVISASFNGAGDTVSPTLLNLFCFWLFEIPVAYLLGIRMGMGPRGAFIGMALAFSMLAFTSALVFRRGRWKTRVV